MYHLKFNTTEEGFNYSVLKHISNNVHKQIIKNLFISSRKNNVRLKLCSVW